MELLHGSEFREIRAICSDTVKTFGRLFLATAHAELLRRAVADHRKALEPPVSHHYDLIPARPTRNIAPARSSTIIPPHVPDDNHSYEQEPAAKLSATIVGWREVKSLTRYGVYVIEVACSDGRPPKLVYKRFREFERLFNAYGKLVGNGKLRMPSTSTSSASTSSGGSDTASNGKTSPTNGAGSRANKFDPDFHKHRAVELQPLLTGLCQRPDVFGMTKFMRWLYFEKQKDIPLLTIFDSAFQQTLDCYQVTSPVYANGMVDALTWLLFLRISHIWERLRKSFEYLAVKAVQDVILKAAGPLDDMILQLNEMNLHFHAVLTNQPSLLLRPVDTVDAQIAGTFKVLVERHEPGLRSFLARLSSELTPHLVSVGASVKTKLYDLTRLVNNNILNDGDESSITALVNAIEDLHRLASRDLIPFLARLLASAHTLAKSCFATLPPLLASFNAISSLAPLLPRFVELLLPPETALDVFLLVLELRNTVEALDASLTETSLAIALNEAETALEREAEKLEHTMALRARQLHGDLKRHHPSLLLVSAALANSLLKMGKLWAKWLRKFVQLAGDFLAIQREAGSYVTWTLATRECLSLAWSLSCEYLADQACKIAQHATHSLLVALLEPITMILVNDMCFSERAPLESTLQSLPFATPSKPTAVLIDILEPSRHAALQARALFAADLRSKLDPFFSQLSKAWGESPSATYTSELDQQRHAKIAAVHDRLQRDIQRLEMAEEMKVGALTKNLDRRGTMAGSMPTLIMARKSRNGTQGSSGAREISSHSSQGHHPTTFSESPVARVIHRSSVSRSTTSQNGTSTTEKELDADKLKKELTMLSRLSTEDQKSEPVPPGDLTPALSVDFEVPKKAADPAPLSPQQAWARASRSVSGSTNRRQFYQVPDEASSSAPSPPTQSPTTAPRLAPTNNTDDTPSSPPQQRQIARKPTSNTRPGRPSVASTSSTASNASTAQTTSSGTATSSFSSTTSVASPKPSVSGSSSSANSSQTSSMSVQVPTQQTSGASSPTRGWTPFVLPRNSASEASKSDASAASAPVSNTPATQQSVSPPINTVMREEPALVRLSAPAKK